MKIMRALIAGTLVAFGAGTLATAAEAPEAAVGTWTLNAAKSKLAGPAPKSMTRTYAQTAEGVSLSIKGVAADGSAISQQSTFKYDGKDYPFTGSPLYDGLSLSRVDANTVKSTQKKGGKAVGTTTRKLSADGKMLTVSTKGTDAKGMAYEDVSVWDRQ
jgi:hypothetical protein